MGSGGKRGSAIFLAYLNGYGPEWADALGLRMAEIFSRPFRRLDVELDLGPSYDARRQQHEATLLLAGLLRHLPDAHSRIVGITSEDLFIPVLTFVFGLSQLGGPGALVSTHRLQNEFYGLPRDDRLFFERTVKGAIHELGHAFGLVHCPDYRCVMHAATYVEDVDLKDAGFCAECETLLERAQVGDEQAGADGRRQHHS